MKNSIFLLVQALVRLKEMEEDSLVVLGEKEILVPESSRLFGGKLHIQYRSVFKPKAYLYTLIIC